MLTTRKTRRTMSPAIAAIFRSMASGLRETLVVDRFDSENLTGTLSGVAEEIDEGDERFDPIIFRGTCEGKPWAVRIEWADKEPRR